MTDTSQTTEEKARSLKGDLDPLLTASQKSVAEAVIDAASPTQTFEEVCVLLDAILLGTAEAFAKVE